MDTAIQETYDSGYSTSPPPDPNQPSSIELWRAGTWLNLSTALGGGYLGKAVVEIVKSEIEATAAAYAAGFLAQFALPPEWDSAT